MSESKEKSYRGMGVFKRSEDEVLEDGKIVLKDREFLGNMLKVNEEIDLEEDGVKTQMRIVDIKDTDGNKSDITLEKI